MRALPATQCRALARSSKVKGGLPLQFSVDLSALSFALSALTFQLLVKRKDACSGKRVAFDFLKKGVKTIILFINDIQ